MSGLDGIELLVYDKKTGRSGRRQLAAEVANREFDVLLNMHASWRANQVSRVIRAKRRIGFDRARARDFQWLFTDERIAPQYQPHVIDGLFAFAEQVGVRRQALDWRLPLAAPDYSHAEQFDMDRPLLLISPCSSDRSRNFRNWPAARFVDVARFAAEQHNAQIVVTGGPSTLEMEYADDIANGVDEVVNLVGKTSLKELAALIDRADAVICPDSGPAHIATAVDTPVVGLYATSNPGRTGPSQRSDWIVNQYPQACRQYLSKSVDELRWGQRVRHPDAMALITVAAVTEKLNRLLGSG